MNKTLYYDNPYLKNTTCTVTSVENKGGKILVTTDRTIFYPECGGQPGDRGFLGKNAVLDTSKAENGDSVLVLDGDCSVAVGDEYELVLDWNHRYRYMVMHTTQHMLSGLLFTMFGIGTVSVHLGEDYLTIETNQSEVASEAVETLILRANEVIRESHSVIYHEMSHSQAEELGLRRSIKVDGDVRIVEICGVDRIACGGVHVGSTSEIQLVTFCGNEQIRGHVRLFFRCGISAISHYEDLERQIGEVLSGFGCTLGELGPKLEKITSQLSETRLKLEKISSKLAFNELKTHISEKYIAGFESEIELSAFLSAPEKYEDLALCVVNETHWMIVLKGRYSGYDFNVLRKTLFGPCGAKGGGRTPVFQGILDPSKSTDFIQGFITALKA